MTHIPFIKMHGTGNDFAIVDARARDLNITNEHIANLANRHTGIGFDQFIQLKPSVNADVFMQIINADGSEVGACGNATRCIGWMIAQEKNATEVMIETKAGILNAKLAGNHKVTVNMGSPKFDWQEIPLASAVDTENAPVLLDGFTLPPAFCVNMGNPHAVFFVDAHERVDLLAIGPKIEHHNLFPERVNVSVARVIGDTHIKLDVWERGAGITQSCGTAACATLVAAIRRGLIAGNKAIIQLPGGDLSIEWDNATNHVWMTGAVAESFRGEVDL